MIYSKMVKPQMDLYDSIIYVNIAGNTPANSPKITPIESLWKSEVCIGKFYQESMTQPRYEQAYDLTSLYDGIELLQSWGSFYQQFLYMATCIQPLVDTSIQNEYRHLAVGSSSSSISLPLGYLSVTVDNVFGCAQALVHEIAHQKLRALGIIENKSSNLVLNGLERTVKSPLNNHYSDSIINVLHELYTLVHIVNLDVCIIDQEDDCQKLDHLYQLLFKNSTKLQFAFDELKDKIIVSSEFCNFWNEFVNWIEELSEEADRILDSTMYKKYNESMLSL